MILIHTYYFNFDVGLYVISHSIDSKEDKKNNGVVFLCDGSSSYCSSSRFSWSLGIKRNILEEEILLGLQLISPLQGPVVVGLGPSRDYLFVFYAISQFHLWIRESGAVRNFPFLVTCRITVSFLPQSLLDKNKII